MTGHHTGAHCEPEAPKDCPIGWAGQVGGNCALHPCTQASDCGEGNDCVEHAVCLEPFQDEFYDYNESENEDDPHGDNGRLLRSPYLLAGPVAPRKRRATPITRYNAVNLCSADVLCAAPRTCQTEKLCVPNGKRAMAYKGANTSPARVARKTATPITASSAAPTEATSPKITTPPRRGCSGCATTSASPDPLLALAALALLVRRRK